MTALRLDRLRVIHIIFQAYPFLVAKVAVYMCEYNFLHGPLKLTLRL